MRYYYWVCLITGEFGQGFDRPKLSKKVLSRDEFIRYRNEWGILPPSHAGEDKP